MRSFILTRLISLSGLDALVQEHLEAHKRSLPNRSQWYRLMQEVQSGRPERVHRFLAEREHKKKVKDQWTGLYVEGDKALSRWLLDSFLAPIESAKHPEALKGVPGSPRIGLPLSLQDQFVESLRVAVMQKVFGELIDRVLLLKGEETE